MAISMKKWVDITSTTQPAGASDRELILRLVTKSSSIDRDTVYEMTTLADVKSFFDESSDEYKIAAKYFGFVSISGTAPEKISFWRPGQWIPSGESSPSPVDDDITTTLTKMAYASDNFATFFFVNRNGADFTTTDYAAAATWCAAQDQKFRFVVPVNLSSIATQTGSITWTKAAGAETYLSNYKKRGVTAVLDDAIVSTNNYTTYPEWLTCALLASTRYSRANSTIIQEFKALNSADMNVTCNSDSLYGILTALNVNFFGETQKAGKLVSFYMEGYNLDGTDTSIYDNEIWLKDRVATEVFNRFVTCNKVPAGPVGRAMIKSAITGVVSEGLNNLSVQPEKEISDSDKASIVQNTGATDAPAQLYTNGFYLDVKDGVTEAAGQGKRRVVDYILYYLTGEGIRKVTGSHVLV